uniref:Uncharacterized protein n=1 Tax=Cyprinus carpio carpio TaxID=630221 RepID=A0A9J8C488_CYPCA
MQDYGFSGPMLALTYTNFNTLITGVMCTDHGAEYIEKPDQTDSDDNERSEEAGTEKPNRDVLVKRNRPACQREKMSSKKRKYSDSYIAFGFTWIGDAESPNPQCVVCGEVLANSSLKPSYMVRHLQTRHSQLQDMPASFFQGKLAELQKKKKIIHSHSGLGTSKNAQKASYLVSYHIAKKGMPHTIGENLCLPVAKDMVNCMLGEKAAKTLDKIPLSDNTVSRRIDSISTDIFNQLISRIKNSEFFSLQIDESTDVANLANLLVYVRYLFENTVHEDFLFCRPLVTHSTGEDIFNLMDSFFRVHEVDWARCVGICTDGAKAMTGRHKGSVALIRKIAPAVSWVPCSIHREALATKNMPGELLTVLHDVVKIVNFIKARPLNSRIFRTICNEMGSEHETLLLHTEVRWLSRGKEFFVHHPFHLSSCLQDDIWLQRLAYLADIFSTLNELNLSLQGLSTTVFNTQDKVEALIKKLVFWANWINTNSTECFPLLSEFLQSRESVLSDCVKGLIIEHLNQLSQNLRIYFPPMDQSQTWIRNPFDVTPPIPHLSFQEQEKLLELSSNGRHNMLFKNKSLVDFWASAMVEYPGLSKQALKVLMPFATTYLCEAGFSALTLLKTKHRQRLDAENDLRVKLSSITPNFDDLCANMQAHPSH